MKGDNYITDKWILHIPRIGQISFPLICTLKRLGPYCYKHWKSCFHLYRWRSWAKSIDICSNCSIIHLYRPLCCPPFRIQMGKQTVMSNSLNNRVNGKNATNHSGKPKPPPLKNGHFETLFWSENKCHKPSWQASQTDNATLNPDIFKRASLTELESSKVWEAKGLKS